MISTEKPGTPAELVHFGVKGMKWGVRKQEGSTGDTQSKTFWTPERKATAKKVAIGTGVLVAAAGAGFVAYKLHQNGKLPFSSIAKASAPASSAVKKVLEPQTDVIHLARGKDKGLSFLKKGGSPSFFQHWENAFVKEIGNPDTDNVFHKLSDGKIAAAFLDPQGRRDHANRPIAHQVVIPRSMASSIANIDDVKTKIWPQLKDTYDSAYLKPKGQL